jgi:glucose-1-phosphate thymidylyltransferase
LDDKNKIVDFQEKPKFPKTTLAAVGLYFFPKQILKEISRYLDEGGTCDEPGYFITWLCENDQVYAISLPGDWFDIGNVESYHRANAIWQELNEGTT